MPAAVAAARYLAGRVGKRIDLDVCPRKSVKVFPGLRVAVEPALVDIQDFRAESCSSVS
jgi:hypothetical protein